MLYIKFQLNETVNVKGPMSPKIFRSFVFGHFIIRFVKKYKNLQYNHHKETQFKKEKCIFDIRTYLRAKFLSPLPMKASY